MHPEEGQIRAQLGRVLESEGFVRADRLSRLLRYAVEQTLAGKADAIKEYTLGVEVFDKEESFDPRIDTAVRVQARRLRSALVEYYAGPGKNDPILIEFPKGSYVPVFRSMDPPAPSVAITPHPAVSRRWAFAAAVPVLGGLAYWLARGTPASAHRRSLAVLPFRLLQPVPELDYLGVGMADALITRLTNQQQIILRPTSSVLPFAGWRDPLAAGKSLQVDFVLEGNLHVGAGRVRLNLQLIEVAKGHPVWGNTYHESLDDLPRIEELLTRQIAESLAPRLTDAGTDKRDTRLSTDPEAHRLFLQGRYHYTRFTQHGALKAIEFFRAATAKDPSFSRAWAAIAETILNWCVYYWPPTRLSEAQAAAEKAVQLDPNVPEAQVSLALSQWFYRWDWPAAESTLMRAAQANPFQPLARDWLGQYLAQMRRFNEARRQFAGAIELDPVGLVTQVNQGMVDYYDGQFERAAKAQEAVLASEASFYPALIEAARSWDHAGNHRRALDILIRAERVEDIPWTHVVKARVHARLGDHRAARNHLAAVENGQAYVSPAMLAMVHEALGESSRAMDRLEQAEKERSPWITFLAADPAFHGLRKEARFQDLLRRVKLA